MPYIIMVSTTGVGRSREWEPTEISFADDQGREAGEWVKGENHYGSLYGRMYKALKVSNDNPLAWRQREEARFEDGTYQRLPWHQYYRDIGMTVGAYYEHIDPNDPTKVRFIEDSNAGIQERYTSMNPGRFVKHYIDFDVRPTLLDEWCAKMGLDMTVSPLKLVKTAEEIIRVYTEGPHSCMSYKLDDDRSHPFNDIDQHPVSVYGDSDLAVAYIERNGEITARCLVYPEKKVHGRIYGDTARLLERLKENGYIEAWNNLAGAKIRQLRTQDDRKQLILPYIDGDLGVIPEGTDWLILSRQPTIIGKSPYGKPAAEACQRCGRAGVYLDEYRELDEDGHEGEPEYFCAEGCNT